MLIRNKYIYIYYRASLLLGALIFICTACATNIDIKQNQSEKIKIENFALLDHRGKFHDLYYYSDQKAIILISQVNGCPIIQKSYAYLEELKKKYEQRGVGFFLINANPADDRKAINEEAKSFNVDIPILEDRSQVISVGLGIKRTAEAILINPKDWSILYHGPINDQFGYETQKTGRVKEYLNEAIIAFLTNKPISKSNAEVKGCLISFEDTPSKPLTYVDDIAPILINKCIVCHSQGQIAPWSMDNFKIVKGHGAMIKEVVRVKRMPPWGADSTSHALRFDSSLNPQEMRSIVHWVDQGMVRGQGEDILLKVERPPTDGWPLGKPDFIVSLNKEQLIPPIGSLDYRTVDGDKVLDQDAWIRAVYWKPGNRKALHHAHLMVDNKTNSTHYDWFKDSGHSHYLINKKKDKTSAHIIDGYNPGIEELQLPDDLGMFLPKETRFSFKIHYAGTGKTETDRTQVGLYFHKRKPSHIFSIYYYGDIFAKDNSGNLFKPIPAHEKEYKAVKFFPIKENIILYAIKPHMHLRGRSMKFIIHYPNAQQDIILSVPKYRFNCKSKKL